MAFLLHIQIDGNPDVEFLEFPTALYVLPDKQLVDLMPDVVWCYTCNRFRIGESSDFRDDILSHHGDNAGRKLVASWLPNFDAKGLDACLSNARRWLELRVSPPRCLHCGGDSIWNVGLRRPPVFPLPSTGKQVTTRFDFADTRIDRRLFLYSVEGDLIGEIPRRDPCSDQPFNAATPYSAIAKMLEAAL